MNESSLYGISPADLVAGTYELAVQEERDATVYPWNRSYLVGDNPAGVLDRDGTDIPNSALIRTAGRISQSPRKIASWRIARYHGTVIFGGYMIDHYGHFLLESLARLWFAVDNDLPIVWASGVNLQDYQKDILTRLGIDLGRMLFLKKPT